MKLIQKGIKWLVASLAMLPLLAISGEVVIPNTFVAGSKAVAAEVNANFDAAAAAINDNDSRISALETAVEALQNSPALTVDTFYFTDLLFISASGDLIVADVAGGQSAPGVVATGVDWHAVPNLTNVPFSVEKDGTVVVFQSVGEMYLSQFSAYARGNVGLAIDGVMPENGAQQSLRMVTDDNLSGGGQSWHLLHAEALSAGTHTFTLYVMGGSQNQSSIAIEGRSGTGYDGRAKITLTQIH